MAEHIYTKQFVKALETIYGTQSHFLNTFGGSLQVLDGVSSSDTAMSIKTNNQPSVVQTYSKDANVAFGTGTGNSSRFGERTEIKSVEINVPYEAPLAIHEGVDNVTVNDDANRVVLERLALAGEAWTEELNSLLGKAISDNAGKKLEVELTEAGVKKLFADAHKEFTNNKIKKNLVRRAYVNSDVYAILVDSNLTTTAKNSSVNIDDNTLMKYKGFVIEELADEYFQVDEVAKFAVDGVGTAGVGIQVVRTIDATDFYGTAIQGLGKYAKYISENNKKGIIIAKTTTAPQA